MHRSISLATVSVLLLTLVLSVHSTQSAPLATPTNPTFGLNTNIASRYPTYESLSTPADAIADLGAGWAREDFQFFRINPQPDEFDWSWQDRMVELLTQRGVSILGVLNGPSPGWATPADDGAFSFFAPDPAKFADFAGAAAARYKGRIRYWQIWNEPDNASGLYWQPRPNMAEYAALLKAAYTAIKQSDPGAQVLSGGMVSPQPAAASLQALASHGAWNSFDIIAVHPYTDPRGPEDGQIDIAGVETVRGVAANLGDKPIWATEFGWSTGPADRTEGQGTPVDENAQANFLIRAAALLRSAGVDHIFWYCLKDTESKSGVPHNLYGLIRHDGTRADYGQGYRKPAYLAYKTMAEQLAGTVSAERLELGEQTSVFNFEQFNAWQRGDEPNGELTRTSEQVHSGNSAARLSYNFSTPENDYVVFLPPAPLSIPGNPTTLGIWVYGNGSGYALNVWLQDNQGEVLQFRLGPVGSPGWKYISTPLRGQVDQSNIISGQGNGQLDFPISLRALVLDDDPNESTGSGVIYLDDLTASTAAESYAVRFTKGGTNEVVDVIWAAQQAEVAIPTNSGQGRRVRTWGETTTETPQNGVFRFTVGPDPIFLHHIPGTAPIPTPTPPVGPTTPPGPDQRCFEATGQCISGRIRQFWEENDGLRVFGYPITSQRQETIEGRTIQVQWFERNRIELHPENQRPLDVLLGRLGADRLVQQQRDWTTFPKTTQQPGCQFFAETGHNICGNILTAWRASGLELDGVAGKNQNENLSLFGLPLSDPQIETIDGRQITVQWFERARFELHPENSPPNDVLLGLLGAEVLQGE